MKYTLKQCQFYTFFRFSCNYLNISGRKLPGFFLKKEMTKSKLHKNKETVLKLGSYTKCKIRISLNLLDKLTCCSKTVLFSTKLDQFVLTFCQV